MRNQLIQTRVSIEEFERIQKKCRDVGMTQSTYVRAVLLEHEIRPVEYKREIARQIFKMISIMNQMERTEEVEKILEGAYQICQYLK